MSSNDSALDPSGFPDPGRPRYCARCGASLEERDHGGRRRPVCPHCGWTYYAKNALGAAVVIERRPSSDGGGEESGASGAAEAQILLVQRAHEPYQGQWMLPAGFVEYGEDAAVSAVREAQEECGLEVRIDSIFGIYFGTDDPRNPAYLIVYRASPVDPAQEPAAGDDACAAGWFTRDSLPAQIAFEAHRRAIGDWAA